MTQDHPTVQEETLTYQRDGQTQEILLGTAEWYAWLDSAATFTFRSASGTFTARKERSGNQRGGWYWKAYRKRRGKLFSVYLGKSETITGERLQAVAASLNRENHPAGSGPQAEHTALPPTSSFFNLPAQLTSLVGREQETEQVCALLLHPQTRLLTLLGPGGVGKTRLALAAAERLANRFANGVVFVSLAPIRDPGLVAPAIADALGLHQGTLQEMQRLLQEQSLLLVLDNVEQVASAAPFIEKILLACPQIKALLTSRAALHLPGERQFPVPPLSLPDPHTLSQVQVDDLLNRSTAIALFLQRAQALLPQFQLTAQNMRAIAAICMRLDGLPLAIELAAARSKLFPPQALLARLTPRLAMLTGGSPALPLRQQTLRNTLQWSYDLLSPDERWLFRRVAVFVGGCTLEALTQVCGAPGLDQRPDVLNGVSSLLDHSLLSQVEQQGEEPRLTMLETVREYALDCLEENGETEDVRYAHAQYYLALAEEMAPPRKRTEQSFGWLRRLTEEQENLRAALGFLIEHKEAEPAVQLSGALWWYWVNRGYFSEGRAFLSASLSLPHSGGRTSERARALCGAGDLALRQSNYQVATVLLEESVSIYREIGETRGLAQALLNLGLSIASAQQFSQARTLIEQSMALAREMDDLWLLGHAQDSLSRLAWKQGDLKTTRVLAEQGLQLAPRLGELRAQVSPRKLLAMIALAEGDYYRATEIASTLLAISQERADRDTEFSALFTLGTVALRQREHGQASDLFKRCLEIAFEIGSARNRSVTLARLGELACEQGDYPLASERFRESLLHAQACEDKEVSGGALLGLARVAKAEKQYWRAAHLLGAAEARIALHTDLDALARAAYERDAAALQTYLGKETYARARDAGSQMAPEQVLALPEPAVTRNAYPGYPDELTEREVEVLRLVASGLTDKEIAEQLVVSPRTIQGHLRSIYRKIQAHSRSAATRYAVERYLL